jgi:DNA-binding LacI/PurR family transcriptional regulator
MKKRPTIRDVAEKAGVSIATVSFVLNKRPGEAISERVRKRVTKAAEQLAYHPSASARGLATQRTRNLALVSYRDPSAIANPFYSFVVQGIIKETTRREYNLLFSFVDDIYEGAKDLPQAVRERNAEGVLVMHLTSKEMATDIQQLGVPIAAIDVYPHLDDAFCVDIDNVQGAKLATNHLLELGHRRLGFIYGAPERVSIAQRADGFREALAEAGLGRASASALYECEQLNHDSGYARAKELLASPKPPTGIVCANDELAAGVLRAAYELGVSVPRQLSVVGFDNIVMSDYSNPPLTTVGIDKEEMGRRAVAGLLDLVEKKATSLEVVRMHVDLVVRKSTGPAPTH